CQHHARTEPAQSSGNAPLVPAIQETEIGRAPDLQRTGFAVSPRSGGLRPSSHRTFAQRRLECRDQCCELRNILAQPAPRTVAPGGKAGVCPPARGARVLADEHDLLAPQYALDVWAARDAPDHPCLTAIEALYDLRAGGFARAHRLERVSRRPQAGN